MRRIAVFAFLILASFTCARSQSTNASLTGRITDTATYGATKIIQPAPVPFPLSAQDAASPPPTLNPPVVTILVADPDLKLPRSYQWNVALEQSIESGQSVSLTYIAAVGRNLLRNTKLFNVNPNFQTVVLTDNSATSDYHSLQVKFQRRFGEQG